MSLITGIPVTRAALVRPARLSCSALSRHDSPAQPGVTCRRNSSIDIVLPSCGIENGNSSP
ncbi:hypothetical protein RGF97_07700 [Streptomyces roseicoloratus]|uniref:Uncharacterized protein n=1 Tax=Streptomyces roseicoloratus TaxID=2508722 RepID=A0ABY9RTF3_9ACTN|nr:hypothetical protein [Streptomyces roseicoloratus]WMX44761.1 hypothetical protein RGF97_07700 [Streptomyces roseicoloratus]